MLLGGQLICSHLARQPRVYPQRSSVVNGAVWYGAFHLREGLYPSSQKTPDLDPVVVHK